MKKIRLMHSLYGRKNGQICKTCMWLRSCGHFPYYEYEWCTLYGRALGVHWKWYWKYAACGHWNSDINKTIMPVKNVYRYSSEEDFKQLQLF